jgi:hypothetical protein
MPASDVAVRKNMWRTGRSGKLIPQRPIYRPVRSPTLFSQRPAWTWTTKNFVSTAAQKEKKTSYIKALFSLFSSSHRLFILPSTIYLFSIPHTMPAVISREYSMPIAKSHKSSGRITKKHSAASQKQWIKNFTREASTNSNTTEIKRLERELAFSCDTLATIVVMIESLQRAYDTCRPDQSEGRTRLNAAERELLAEYDDLELQMSHLEKKIAQMEAQLTELKGCQPTTPEHFVKLEVQAPVFGDWELLQYVPQQSLSPEEFYTDNQESTTIKMEDMVDWIDWSVDSF